MSIRVYAILSSLSGDLLFGTAYDWVTYLSLIELAKLKGATTVSLHGELSIGNILSEEVSITDAYDLLYRNVFPNVFAD